MAALALAAALLFFGAGPDLDARVARLLDERGLGAEALSIIGNTLRHEAPPPRAAPQLVVDLLARPLQAVDAAAIFDRVVPRPLLEAASPARQAQPFDRLLAAYVAEVGLAREELLVATGNAPLDEPALLADVLANGHPSADRLLQVAAATDLDGLAVANERFILATTRFALALRSATGVPAETTRFDLAIGTIIIGARGDDTHELKPATHGAISVVIDLGGNDTYTGADVAVRGFSAIIDFDGDDRYDMRAGLGAAIAGASLLVDHAGDDSYRARLFGEGAAGFGLAALIDLAGNDTYELDAWGQGFGLPGGVALLWDAGGNDRYTARGPADAYERGGGLSGAQGAGMGPRTMLAGGIGVLRDDAGDDVYVAEMFAQGTGYYYGLGLLWDRGGNDRYQAVRYSQGTGTHEAVGVLRDDGGNDRYELSVGVGQAMGLDLAVGVLYDAAGDDVYTAGLLAQAASTANGIGVLVDLDGANRWEIAQGERQWGHGEWLRDMPTFGVLLHDPARASFVSGGKALATPPAAKKVTEPEPAMTCPAGVAVDPREIETVRKDFFEALLEVSARIRCAVKGDAAKAETLWRALDAELARDPATPLGATMALAWREAPPPEALRQRMLARLDAHPYCSVRAAALSAVPRADVARRALRSACFRLQAAALRTLETLGEPAPADAPLPRFLR